MPVEVLIEDPSWEAIDLPDLAQRAVDGTLSHLGLAQSDVSLLAADDTRVATLNATFRDKPKPTNVLSWPSEDLGAEKDGDRPLNPTDPEIGDIALAYGVCSAEADAGGLSLADHTTHLIVHGTLHLLGYDHERDGDATLMERIEVEILGKLGVADPHSRDTG